MNLSNYKIYLLALSKETDSKKSKTGTKPVFSEPEGLNARSIALFLLYASMENFIFP